MKTTVALETLGCKVNQYESSYLLEELGAAGYRVVPFREVADVYIVHGCAVTGKAAYQTRQLLRRAQRLNPGARIVAAGCAAQLEPDRMAREQLATHILGNAEKFDLLRWLKVDGRLGSPCRAISDPRSFSEIRALPVHAMHAGRSRAFLKVQDGCDTFCAYCIVPYTRGRSRSLPAGAVREQLDCLLGCGYREVVLTGIHLGQWGKELRPAQDLAGLLEQLSAGPMPERVRLSSLEPMEWSAPLLRHIEASPHICPHFHVPLQSGNAEVLARMQRPYTPQHYAEVIHTLHDLFQQAALGADVMVGFPGESAAQFESSCALIESLPLTYLHVFPYSPRPGTPAAEWPGRLPGPELKRRAAALQAIGLAKRTAFRNGQIGSTVEVLVETEESPGVFGGTSQNYIPVQFASTQPLSRGTLVQVRLERLTESGVQGRMLAIGR